MPTAKNSNRFDGGILNPSLERWDGGSPTNYDATLTNATMVQLTKEMHDFHRAGIPQVEVTRLALNPNEPLVHDGFSAVRIYATTTWAARSVNLRPEGLGNDLLGTVDFGLPWDFDTEGLFSFWARGTRNKQFEVVFAMRNAASTQRVYMNTEPATWSTTQTGIIFELNPTWRLFNVRVKFPFTVDDGASPGENAGLPSTDSLVFGFFNVSTADVGAGDPFVWDIDDLGWDLKSSRRQEES